MSLKLTERVEGIFFRTVLHIPAQEMLHITHDTTHLARK